MLVVLRWVIVLFGLLELFGLLPHNISFLYKITTILLLLMLWYEMRPGSFILGKDSRKLDIGLLAAMVIFSLDVFIRFIEVQYGIIAVFALPYVIAASVLGQTVLIFVVALYATKIQIGEKSAVHSLIYIFNKTHTFWTKFSTSNKPQYLLYRFISAFSVYFLLTNYLFLPIMQWFVLTLDKSLIIIAIMFAARKHKGLDWISNFSDRLISKLSTLCTEPKFAHIALGMLLMIHYISDISFFLLPYILHKVPFDYEYYALDPAQHQSLYSLFISEGATGSNAIFILWTYLFSGAGLLFLVLIPVILMFLHIYNIDLKDFDWKKRFLFPLLIIMLASSVFLMAPGVFQKPILKSEVGAYGVDFVSSKISTTANLLFNDIFLFSLVIFMLVSLSLTRRGTEFYVVLLFLASMMYFSFYCWNFFISNLDFYINFYPMVASNVSDTVAWAMPINRIVLPILSTIFYIGGLIILTIYLSKYIIEGFLHKLLKKKYIIIWLFGLMAVSVFLTMLLDDHNYMDVLSLFLSFFVMTFIFNIALYLIVREKGDYRFLVAISVTMIIFPLVSILSIPFESFLSPEKMELVARTILVAAAVITVSSLKLHLNWNKKLLVSSVIIGIVFGLAFSIINEPLASAPGGIMLYVFLLLVSISEELLFRGAVLQVSLTRFGNGANLIQAFLFTLAHFLFAKSLILQFQSVLVTIVFFFVVLIFGIAAGKLAQKNMAAAVIAHLIANVILYTT